MRCTFAITLSLSCAIFLAAAVGWAQEGQGDAAAGVAQLFASGNTVRGTVTVATEASPGRGTFTVRTEEGESYQVQFSPNTRLLKDRQPVPPSEVHVGDMLIAAGEVNHKAKSLGAVFLLDVDAEKVRSARASFGKTWTGGKVTEIRNLTITLERMGDKQKQIIGVDENTSFRKGREDVTLKDIKVGDYVSAQGAIHNDLFMATILHVMDPSAMKERGSDPQGLFR